MTSHGKRKQAAWPLPDWLIVRASGRKGEGRRQDAPPNSAAGAGSQWQSSLAGEPLVTRGAARHASRFPDANAAMPGIHPQKAKILAFAMIAGGLFVLITAAVLWSTGQSPGMIPAVVAAVGVAELLFGVMILVQKGSAR